MASSKESLESLIQILQRLSDQGVLEPGQKEATVRAIRRLRHGCSIGDLKEVRKAVGELAREFVRLL
jgi:hypothetical protein